MAARKSSVTLNDVAREAGVSSVVASAVINGARTSTRVGPGTRERVLEAARTLRYVPNAAAQSLTRRAMNMLGVSFSRAEFTFVSNPYVAHLMEGILGAAAARGFTLALFPDPWMSAAHSAAPYSNGRTDGLIVIAPSLDSDMVPELAAMGQAMVLISVPAEVWNVPTVCVDNERGARMAAEHLLELGHRHIAFLSVDGEEVVADVAERRRGFLGRLQVAGVPVPDGRIVPGNFNFADGYATTRTLLLSRSPRPPTAIFAANDHSALGALQAARDLGVPVPERLSIIGFDDVPEAVRGLPPLTTIRSPLEAMGRHAAELLIVLITEGYIEARTHYHPPELVIRASTAPPPLPGGP